MSSTGEEILNEKLSEEFESLYSDDDILKQMNKDVGTELTFMELKEEMLDEYKEQRL